MTDPAANEYLPDSVSPPGTTLAEVLAARGMSQAQLAHRMGRPKKTISEIVTGKAAITADTALQLERVLGIPAAFWNARESHYREALARAEEDATLSHSTRWLRSFPLADMRKTYGLPKSTKPIDRVREMLGFFGVASVEQWHRITDAEQTRLRAPAHLAVNTPALAVWLRMGEARAQDLDCEPFNEDRFREALQEARALTREGPETFCPALERLCAASGVALAFVPEIRGVHVSGAARWMHPRQALIQLSLRYRSDDQLWFSFFHEAGHILLHGKRDLFVDDERSDGAAEREADKFAADALIPWTSFQRFCSAGAFSKASIRRFADTAGIAPGIVVGRLQHDGMLPYSHCNDLKRRLAWKKTACQAPPRSE